MSDIDQSVWTRTTVGEVKSSSRNALVGGPFGSNLVTSDYVPLGVPVIRGENMGHGRWIDGDFVFISEEKAERLSANQARPGDLIFTQRGTIGQVAMVPQGRFNRLVISQSQMKLTPDKAKADPLFLYYVFSSPEQVEYIRRNAIQTGVPHTNLGILRDTPLNLPPIEEQRAIAEVLGTLDDKIELNLRMNETLEATARAIFKSWFVDFDPVRAAGEGGQPGGMAPQIDAFFQNRFVDGIPDGWKTITFANIAWISRDSLNPLERGEESFAHYSIPAFDEMRMPVVELGATIKSNKFLVPRDAVLVSKLNPRIPRVWMPKTRTDLRNICSTEFLVTRPKEGITREYLYALCSSQMFQQVFTTMVTGTSGSHQRVKSEFLEKIEIVVPPPEIVNIFTETVRPIYDRVSLNLEQNRVLASLRDTLLPKLLSGELRLQQQSSGVGV